MDVDQNQVTLFVDEQRSEEPTKVQNNDARFNNDANRESSNINQQGSNEREVIVISDERLLTSLIIKTFKHSIY